VLVAELVPEDKGLLAPGRTYRVAGVAAVALSAAAAAAAVGGGSEESSAPLPFPLLCNVAVDPRLRRLGVGRALVSAAEAVAEEAGKLLFVVARGSEDAAAEKLYSSLGFAEVEGEKKKGGGGSFLSSLFGSKASAEKLMRKQL
jgi:ribosomal protein S18 acetylase RimI-like enzyme